MERLLLWLYEKKVCVGMDDTVQVVETKNGIFFLKSMYKALELRHSISFPMRSI